MFWRREYAGSGAFWYSAARIAPAFASRMRNWGGIDDIVQRLLGQQ